MHNLRIFSYVLYHWPLNTSKTKYFCAQGVQKPAIRNFDSVSAWEQTAIPTDISNVLNRGDQVGKSVLHIQ